MPRKTTQVAKKPRKTYRKRTYRKKVTPNAVNLFSRPRSTPFVPLSRWGTVYYHENFANALSTGSSLNLFGSYIYSMNGLYDPNQQLGGHQPMGFDIAMLMYEHYTVTRSQATIRFFNKTTGPIIVGAYLSPDATPVASVNDMIENQLAVSKQSETASAGGEVVVNIGVDVARYNGKSIINEDDYRGDILSQPAEQVYLILFAYSMDGANNNTNVPFEIEIMYRAKFTEPRKQVGS